MLLLFCHVSTSGLVTVKPSRKIEWENDVLCRFLLSFFLQFFSLLFLRLFFIQHLEKKIDIVKRRELIKREHEARAMKEKRKKGGGKDEDAETEGEEMQRKTENERDRAKESCLWEID